jgi:hypothetical protein
VGVAPGEIKEGEETWSVTVGAAARGGLSCALPCALPGDGQGSGLLVVCAWDWLVALPGRRPLFLTSRLYRQVYP